MSPADPFDFSDFGGRTPSVSADGSPQRGNSAAAQDISSPRSGFDPFARQASTTAEPRTPHDIFAAASATGPSTALTLSGPPMALFFLAVGVSVCGAALGVTSLSMSALPPALAGWLLAGPAAIGTLAWFSSVDTRRRLSSVYSSPAWLRNVYWAVVVICAIGIATGAWQIALWAGRL